MAKPEQVELSIQAVEAWMLDEKDNLLQSIDFVDADFRGVDHSNADIIEVSLRKS